MGIQECRHFGACGVPNSQIRTFKFWENIYRRRGLELYIPVERKNIRRMGNDLWIELEKSMKEKFDFHANVSNDWEAVFISSVNPRTSVTRKPRNSMYRCFIPSILEKVEGSKCASSGQI